MSEEAEVYGEQEVLDELREALSAHPEFAGVEVSPPLRGRPIESLGDALFTVLIHIPPAVAAHALYEWLKGWRSKGGKDVSLKSGAVPP